MKEDAERALTHDGFLILDNPKIGMSIQALEEMRFPLASEYGLDFLRRHIFDDECVRSIIESVFPECVLVHFLRYQAHPGVGVSFMRGGSGVGRLALLVHFWPKGSEAEYFRGSHLHEFPSEVGKRLLWETSTSTIEEAGCEPVHKDFRDGGLVIVDARTRVEMRRGYVIKCQFMTVEIPKEWPKLELPKLKPVEEKVTSMESSKIRINAQFIANTKDSL